MIDWNKRNGGFLSPECVYENQLSNLSMQINEKDKEISRLNNIIEGINDIIKNHYIVGHTVQNASIDSILKEIKELKEGGK